MKKVCLITGATGGIGYHLALGFHEAGYQVIGFDCMGHKRLPEGIKFMKVDLRKPKTVKKAIAEVVKEYGMIHILINNAAISSFQMDIKETSLEEFDNVVDVNLKGAYLCTREFVRQHKGDYGRIINMSSTRALQNEPDWAIYSATKGALISMTNSLAISLAETSITVNAVSPGWIQCEDYHLLTKEDHEQHPSRRVGKPKDILNACLFLAHEENDFVNGHNMVIDGGMTKKMVYID
ncbi:SDR family oxidoreductase [Acidaminobacter sp. JC074]|uniref:SDR family NAD(P)-dependent oxidoreductase n=1 Tax=Acidaminobacter sp. JC074 TaxID=2530199 RepID=UPI001F0D7B3D|nr:SDR family oxidoreductase [Acidaminobacter sp. JC074]MCH4890840.1 SDR family oxidoreductase [Acidaminobacter sp. JC074]